MKGTVATRVFRKIHKSVPALEGFVRSLPFLARAEADKAVILGTETLDNIISYSLHLKNGRVTLRIRKSAREVSMIFWFKSETFQEWAPHSDSLPGRSYDPHLHRYRGLGLAMCRSLSRVYRMRSDSLRDAIIIRF